MISMKFSEKSTPSRIPLAAVPSIFNCDESRSIISEAINEENDVSSSDKVPPVSSVSLTADDHKSLGCALAENGDDDSLRKALSHFEAGLLLAPTNHFLLDLKSQILLHFDKFLLSIKAAEEVVRLAPTWSEGFVTLARAQREFGELELAQTNMQTAQSLDKDNTEYSAELLEINELVVQLHAVRAKYEEQKRSGATCRGICDATCRASIHTASSINSSFPVATVTPTHSITTLLPSTSLHHEVDK